MPPRTSASRHSQNATTSLPRVQRKATLTPSGVVLQGRERGRGRRCIGEGEDQGGGERRRGGTGRRGGAGGERRRESRGEKEEIGEKEGEEERRGG